MESVAALSESEYEPAIDAHHHLWDPASHHYPWLEAEEKVAFFGDYTPIGGQYVIEQFMTESSPAGVVGSVLVEAGMADADPLAEAKWLHISSTANRAPIPNAVVAHVDLSRKDAPTILESLTEYPRVTGVRQLLNRHPDAALTAAERDFMNESGWRASFALLHEFGFSFDLHILPHQMSDAARLAAAFPDTNLIVDHAGLPVHLNDGGDLAWKSGLQLLGRYDNVTIKISGLGMLVRPWSETAARAIAFECLEWFGPGRCMLGSNFPIDRLTVSYVDLWDFYRAIAATLSVPERSALLRGTAEQIYQVAAPA